MRFRGCVCLQLVDQQTQPGASTSDDAKSVYILRARLGRKKDLKMREDDYEFYLYLSEGFSGYDPSHVILRN